MKMEAGRPRARTMSASIGRDLAIACARAIEARGSTISDAIGGGLAHWMRERGEIELAAMLEDGRGVAPRHPTRHEVGQTFGRGKGKSKN